MTENKTFWCKRKKEFNYELLKMELNEFFNNVDVSKTKHAK